MAAALAGAVPRQAAVPARVGNLAPEDLEEAAVRADLVVTVGQQRPSVLQPSNLRDGVTWEKHRLGLTEPFFDGIDVGNESGEPSPRLPETSQVRVRLCFSLTFLSTTVPSSSMLGGTAELQD